jgi:secreted trypsin-like serine protease
MPRAVVLLFLLCPLACSDPDISIERRPIVGGTIDNGDPSVMLMFGGSRSDVSGFQGGTCTAEVISPHLLITAGHCVVDFGPDARFGISSGGFRGDYAVKGGYAHPDYVANPDPSLGHDIAVLITDQAMTETPLELNRSPLTADLVGQPVRMVGFGIVAADADNTSGVKRQTTTTLSSYDDGLLIFDNNGVHGTCEGDSGGPAFMMLGGVEKIAGITSFGDSVDCTGSGYDTRIDTNLDFIDSYVRLADPPPPDMAAPPDAPVWNGHYPIGTAGAGCHSASECYSGLCTSGGERYCTQSCAVGAGQCPLGTHCGTIEGQPFCVRDARPDGGCTLGARAPAPSAAWLLLLAAVLIRRRLFA